MNDIDELLRRDGEQWRATATSVPRVDWAALPGSRRSGMSSWWMVAAASATAAIVVVLAILAPSWIGRGAPAHKPLPAPAHRPGPSLAPKASGGPANFVAIAPDGTASRVDARTGDRGDGVGEPGRRVTSLAVTNAGNLAYATFSGPGCKISVLRFRQVSSSYGELTEAATVVGVTSEAMAISPDGHALALAIRPCSRPSGVNDLVVVDLDTHHQHRWTGYPDGSFLGGLQWAPDNMTLSYVVTPCCGGRHEGPRLLDTTVPGTSYVKPKPLPMNETVGSGLVFWYGGNLAVIEGTEIHALSSAGVVGAVLAQGLPGDVESVKTDATGLHLLLTTSEHRLFRYDGGALTPLPGDWIDAGW